MKLFRARKAHFQSLSSLMGSPSRLGAIHATTTLPTDVAKWLGRLKLLYGVPFNYLVPDEKMLPAESIRFFQVDLNWIYSLIEGAFSIGRATSGDTAHDALFTRRLHTVTRAASRHLRAARLPERTMMVEEHVERELLQSAGFDAEVVRAEVIEREVERPELERLALEAASLGAEEGMTTVATERITGFLLRSAVVEGWPGLEVVAYDANNLPLTNVLRMDHIGPSILLYMVEGVIDHIDIKEPSEGLHFGVDEADAGCGARSLRYVTVPAGAPPNARPGDQIEGATAGAVPCRDGRVLKIGELATAIGSALNAIGANNDKAGNPLPFTSAEFALEMVEGTQAVRFRKSG